MTCCLLAAAAIALLPAIAQNLVDAPAAKLAALGRVLSADLEARETVLEEEAAAAYLARLSERVQGAPNSEFPITVRLLGGREARAIALPGGYLHLTAGLITRTATETELVAVMAHEVAHLRLRHGVRPVKNTLDASVAIPLLFLGGWNGVCARFAPTPLYPLAYRDAAAEFEQQADKTASDLLSAAGFDASALPRIFNRLDRADDAGFQQQAPRNERGPEFEEFKRRIEELTASERPLAPSLFRAAN